MAKKASKKAAKRAAKQARAYKAGFEAAIVASHQSPAAEGAHFTAVTVESPHGDVGQIRMNRNHRGPVTGVVMGEPLEGSVTRMRHRHKFITAKPVYHTNLNGVIRVTLNTHELRRLKQDLKLIVAEPRLTLHKLTTNLRGTLRERQATKDARIFV